MKGFTLWFTGLSGSGKTTLSQRISNYFRQNGFNVERLDGDAIRENLSKGLGFSKEDRDINVKRIGYVCHLLSRNNVIAIAAAIAPYENIRQSNRTRIGRYVEVFCKCSLDELIKRDPKKLYERALRGEIKNFTGISDPYEEPVAPEVICETDVETPQESMEKIITKLETMGYIPARDKESISSAS